MTHHNQTKELITWFLRSFLYELQLYERLILAYTWYISFWYLCVFFLHFLYTALTDFAGMDLTEDQLASIKSSQMPLEDYGSFSRLCILCRYNL
jgi:hypothetical protein